MCHQPKQTHAEDQSEKTSQLSDWRLIKIQKAASQWAPGTKRCKSDGLKKQQIPQIITLTIYYSCVACSFLLSLVWEHWLLLELKSIIHIFCPRVPQSLRSVFHGPAALTEFRWNWPSVLFLRQALGTQLCSNSVCFPAWSTVRC